MSDEYADRRNNDMLIGKLQEGVARQKEDTNRLETKIDQMHKMISDMHEQVVFLIGSVGEIRKEVRENRDDFEEHLKNYVPASKWVSDKFITICLIIAGMLGSAILTQYIFPKILPPTETTATWTPREEIVHNYVQDEKGGVTLYKPPEPYTSTNKGNSPQGGEVIVQGQ
jgi:hypothetical protein